MEDYFGSRRQRWGFGTLLLACVFTVGWVRSLSVTDSIVIHTGANIPESLRLRAGWLRSQKGQIQRIASVAVGKGGRPMIGSAHLLWQIPYWSIVMPLTLSSTFLLLSKPRQSASKAPSESTSAIAA